MIRAAIWTGLPFIRNCTRVQRDLLLEQVPRLPLLTAPTNAAACACTVRSSCASCASRSAGFGIVLGQAGVLAKGIGVGRFGLGSNQAEHHTKRDFTPSCFLRHRKVPCILITRRAETNLCTRSAFARGRCSCLPQPAAVAAAALCDNRP